MLEILPNWLKISHKGREGYVWRAFVKIGTSGHLDTSEPQGSMTQSETVAALEAEACRISREISENTQQVASYTQKELDLIEYLDQTERHLNQTRQKIKRSKAKLVALKKEQQTTQKAIERLISEITTLETYAGKRLTALYKLHQLGKIPIMASATSLHDLLLRFNSLEIISAHDHGVWQQLTQKKEDLSSLHDSLKQQKEAHLVYSNRLEEELQTMARQKKERTKLLADIRGKKALTLAAIDALQQAAEALDHQLEIFSWTIHPVIFDTHQPTESFQTFKGLLKLPVMGKITPKCQNGGRGLSHPANHGKGIDIKTDQGEPIQSIYGGKTIYADWFKGYGNMIIIDHGNNYCSVYAHLQEIFKKQGDSVDQEEVIGTVGDTGSLMGPKLHFEIRHRGKSVDPIAWLKIE